jgi:molybdate transport system substrate-binding protein
MRLNIKVRLKLFQLLLLSFLLPILIVIGNKFIFNFTTQVNLIISVATSLQPMMEEIKLVYQGDFPHVILNYNFGASGLLAQQIEQGAPVNLFFSASSLEMDKLAQKNLIVNTSRRNILVNQIVLISNKNNSYLKNITDLTNKKIAKIIIGNPTIVPAGRYAEQVFNYYQIWNQIKSKLVFAQDEQAVLSYIELGYADVGMVYQSSAIRNEQIKIVAFTEGAATPFAPAQSHEPIKYPIAIIKNSAHFEESQQFIQFLNSSKAQAIFREYHFQYSESENK